MYLDDNLVFDAALARDLAKNIKNVPVKSLVANTGQGLKERRRPENSRYI